MSNYEKPPQQSTAIQTVKEEDPKWDIRDTEFLLRLIMGSKIDGTDLEIAAEVTKKVKKLHASIMSYKVSI